MELLAQVVIVEKVEGSIVCTLEGNSGNSCRGNHYVVGYYEFFGYSTPTYYEFVNF